MSTPVSRALPFSVRRLEQGFLMSVPQRLSKMNFTRLTLSRILGLALILIFTAALVAAQTRGSLRGLITDELGAAIVGANVTLTDSTGTQKKTTTNGEGVYVFSGLAPGKYLIQASAPGFAPSGDQEVNLSQPGQPLDLTLKVTIR